MLRNGNVLPGCERREDEHLAVRFIPGRCSHPQVAVVSLSTHVLDAALGQPAAGVASSSRVSGRTGGPPAQMVGPTRTGD